VGLASFPLSTRRSLLPYRRVFTVSSTEELIQEMGRKGPTVTAGKPVLVLLFTGQGAQWVGCGETLMAFPVYRKAIEYVDSLFRGLAGWSILDKLPTLTPDEMVQTVRTAIRPDDDDDDVSLAWSPGQMYAQPATFLVQVGLVELLKFFRILPHAVVGHSAGEVVAAYAAGILSLEDATRLMYYRSTVQQKLAGAGHMLVVSVSEVRASYVDTTAPYTQIS
jgi:acyl transferase domain-containing protein